MQLGFMSSVCPKYTLPELLTAAKRHGYQGIEPRVEWHHGHGIELTASPKQLSAIRHAFADAGIAITCIATGCRFQTEDKAKNAAELEKLRHYIPVAAAVGAPIIRIFGDTVPTEAEKLDEALQREADAINSIDALAGQHGVVLGLETHGNLLASQAAEVITRAEARHCMILWHAEHHIRNGESIDRAWVFIKPRLCHYQWSVVAKDIPEAEVARTFALLKRTGYDGSASVEDINPPDSEASLKSHAEKFKQWAA